MRMLSKLSSAIATAAIFLAAATPVQAGETTKEKFVHEGYTYVYEVTPTKDGKTISGTRYPGATAFNLKVSGDKVRGVSGGQDVAFNLADAKGAAQ